MSEKRNKNREKKKGVQRYRELEVVSVYKDPCTSQEYQQVDTVRRVEFVDTVRQPITPEVKELMKRQQLHQTCQDKTCEICCNRSNKQIVTRFIDKVDVAGKGPSYDPTSRTSWSREESETEISNTSDTLGDSHISLPSTRADSRMSNLRTESGSSSYSSGITLPTLPTLRTDSGSLTYPQRSSRNNSVPSRLTNANSTRESGTSVVSSQGRRRSSTDGNDINRRRSSQVSGYGIVIPSPSGRVSSVSSSVHGQSMSRTSRISSASRRSGSPLPPPERSSSRLTTPTVQPSNTSQVRRSSLITPRQPSNTQASNALIYRQSNASQTFPLRSNSLPPTTSGIIRLSEPSGRVSIPGDPSLLSADLVLQPSRTTTVQASINDEGTLPDATRKTSTTTSGNYFAAYLAHPTTSVTQEQELVPSGESRTTVGTQSGRSSRTITASATTVPNDNATTQQFRSGSISTVTNQKNDTQSLRRPSAQNSQGPMSRTSITRPSTIEPSDDCLERSTCVDECYDLAQVPKPQTCTNQCWESPCTSKCLRSTSKRIRSPSTSKCLRPRSATRTRSKSQDLAICVNRIEDLPMTDNLRK